MISYLHAHPYLTAALAGVLVAGAVVWAFDRYVLMIGEWPLVGRDWRRGLRQRKADELFRRQAAGPPPAAAGSWLRANARLFAGVPETVSYTIPWCGNPACTSPQCWEAGPRELDDDEAWSHELADMNRARRADELDELSLENTDTRRLYVDLTDDPDLIAWDAKQHAARVWEIVNVQFPTLRADIAAEYAHAAAAAAAYWKAAA